MKQGLNQARSAVRSWLGMQRDPVLLADMACVANRAAKQHRKSDLFDCLSDYESLIPEGWGTAWMNESGSPMDGALLYVVRPGYSGSLKSTRVVPGAFDAATDCLSMRLL